MHNAILKRFERAVKKSEMYLKNIFPDLVEIKKESYPKSWLLNLEINHRSVQLTLSLPFDFPVSVPDIFVADPNQYWLKTPHVEQNGKLCLYTNAAAISINAPEALIEDSLKRAEKILGIHDLSEFYSEFNSYWSFNNNEPVLSLEDDGGIPPSSYFYNSSLPFVLSSDKDNLLEWNKNFGRRVKATDLITIERIDITELISPSEFPNNTKELLIFFKKYAPQKYELLFLHLKESKSNQFYFLRFIFKDTFVYAGIKVPGLNLIKTKGVLNGYKKNTIPHDLLISKTNLILEHSKIERFNINPIGYKHIHSRGGTGLDLSRKKVLIIGAGSLGSYLSHFMAKSGIGNITLCDNEWLSWDNIGRNILGAANVRKSKADSLIDNLGNEMPHLKLNAIYKNFRDVLKDDEGLLKEQDLIICCVGNWGIEYDLNYWARQNKIEIPLVFGWLEKYSLAGHALFVHPLIGGCMKCGCDEWGVFSHRVTELQKEDFKSTHGCSGYFMQYGVIQQSPVVILIAKLSIDVLTGKCNKSELRTWIAPKSEFEQQSIIPETIWRGKMQNNINGLLDSIEWSINDECELCK